MTEREAVIWTSLNGGYLGALKVKNELILSAGYTTLIYTENSMFRPTFFYCLFYGKIFKKIESGGLNKNKNKIHFLVESTIKIKIKQIGRAHV